MQQKQLYKFLQYISIEFYQFFFCWLWGAGGAACYLFNVTTPEILLYSITNSFLNAILFVLIHHSCLHHLIPDFDYIGIGIFIPNFSSFLGSVLQVNDVRLRTAGEASQRSTKEDWAEWMRHFSIELLKESPSPALRTCARLAQLQVWYPFASVLIFLWESGSDFPLYSLLLGGSCLLLVLLAVGRN